MQHELSGVLNHSIDSPCRTCLFEVGSCLRFARGCVSHAIDYMVLKRASIMEPKSRPRARRVCAVYDHTLMLSCLFFEPQLHQSSSSHDRRFTRANSTHLRLGRVIAVQEQSLVLFYAMSRTSHQVSQRQLTKSTSMLCYIAAESPFVAV